jgi:hypothetical protein
MALCHSNMTYLEVWWTSPNYTLRRRSWRFDCTVFGASWASGASAPSDTNLSIFAYKIIFVIHLVCLAQPDAHLNISTKVSIKFIWFAQKSSGFQIMTFGALNLFCNNVWSARYDTVQFGLSDVRYFIYNLRNVTTSRTTWQLQSHLNCSGLLTALVEWRLASTQTAHKSVALLALLFNTWHVSIN